MTALTELTTEQLQYLCERIPHKIVVDYFNSHSKEYNKIWKGRAQSLKRDQIVRLLVTNIKNFFITSFVEKCVGLWFSEIKEFRHTLENEGATADESLLRALPGSVFCDDIDLYFLLSDESYTTEYISLVKNIIHLIPAPQIPADDTDKKEDPADSEQTANIATIEAKLSETLAKVEDLEKLISTEQSLRKQREEELARATSEITELQASLNIAREHISETTHIKAELEELRLLSRYADTDGTEIVETEFEYTSICRVVHSYSDQAWLIRLADVANGAISVFEQAEDIPRYFGNRDRLFWRNGPDENGYIGVWKWNAQPNKNDPSTDYVTTAFNGSIRFIEIVEVPTCHTISELTQYISSSQISLFSGRKILFALPAENNEIKGILCDETNFVKVGDKFKLNSSVYILPQFTIKKSDVISFSGMQLYRFTRLGLPQTLVQVRDPMYVAKDIIISRATSAVLRESGLSKKEAQHCRSFLTELPIGTVAQELSELYACSEEDAQSYIDAFIEHADSYLCSEDLDVSVISAALERNSGLVAICKNMLFDEWRQENELLLIEAKKKLEDIESLITSGESKVKGLKADQQTLQEQLDAITAEIQSKEQLASSVEEKVAERIAAAKSNVADFICEMAFATSYGAKQVSSRGVSLPNEMKVTHRTCTTTQGDTIEDRDTFEEELAENLEKTGYTESYAYEMSQVISFCICNKIPLVINENAGIIADCIASMFGADGAMELTLPLAESSCTSLCHTIQENATAKYNVFIINGVFDGLSLNAYNELLQNYTELNQKTLLILSTRGLSMSMIPAAVWNHAFFIDGDLHLTSVMTEPLTSFSSEVAFVPTYDSATIKAKRKELKPFKDYVCNTAQLNYAMFMATYDEHIASSLLLQLQLIMAGLNNNSLDELVASFASAGVTEENQKLIIKYL